MRCTERPVVIIADEEVSRFVDGDVGWFAGGFFGIEDVQKDVGGAELADAGNLAGEGTFAEDVAALVDVSGRVECQCADELRFFAFEWEDEFAGEDTIGPEFLDAAVVTDVDGAVWPDRDRVGAVLRPAFSPPGSSR